MERLQLAYQFYYWLPPWEREPEYIKEIYDHITDSTTLDDLINEYWGEEIEIIER